MPPAEERIFASGRARVRVFHSPDTDAVLAIAAQSPEAAAWSRDSYETLPEQAGALAFVAEDGGEIVGFVVGREVGGQAEILNLAVSPPRRRRGHASSLLTAALDHFRGCGAQSVYLEVRQSNNAAIEFYSQHGFAKLVMRKDYYRSPDEPAITMMRNLE